MRDRDRRIMARHARGGRWYDIRNATGDVAEIRIYDEISWFGMTAEDFVAELDQVTASEILVSINSPGGDVFDCIAIYNALRNHPARVTTRVDGLAASGASVIVQAGDHRVMMSSGQLMFHEAWGIAIGPAAEMRELADLLEKQNGVIAGIYAARSQHDAEHFIELMASGDQWLTDQEAVDMGLADEVADPKPGDAPVARASGALPEGKGKRLAEHIDSVLTEGDALVARIAEVVTLRTEQGKATDDSWRTREFVERLKAQTAKWGERLSAQPAQKPNGEVAKAATEFHANPHNRKAG